MKLTQVNRMEEDWTLLWCDTVEEILEAVNDREFIWPLIYRGVRRLMDESRTSAMILECRLTDSRETVWISVSEGDVEATLNKLIAYRLEREEYEECAAIRDLLSEWTVRKMPSATQLNDHQISSGANEDK